MTLTEALALLGVHHPVFDPSTPEANRSELAAWLRAAKAAYRTTLRAAHPDYGGTTDRTMQIRAAWELIQNTRFCVEGSQPHGARPADAEAARRMVYEILGALQFKTEVTTAPPTIRLSGE